MILRQSVKVTQSQGGKTVFSTNCVKKTGYSHAKEGNLTLILCHIHKSTQNGLTFKEEIRKYKTPKRKCRAKAL